MYLFCMRMKKYFGLIILATSLSLAGCSGQGAHTEAEKKSQDSVDEISQKDGFDKLYQEEAKSEDSAKQNAEKSEKQDKKP